MRQCSCICASASRSCGRRPSHREEKEFFYYTVISRFSQVPFPAGAVLGCICPKRACPCVSADKPSGKGPPGAAAGAARLLGRTPEKGAVGSPPCCHSSCPAVSPFRAGPVPYPKARGESLRCCPARPPQNFRRQGCARVLQSGAQAGTMNYASRGKTAQEAGKEKEEQTQLSGRRRFGAEKTPRCPGPAKKEAAMMIPKASMAHPAADPSAYLAGALRLSGAVHL